MDIIRGSLDGITRSASNHQRQRPGSSVSLHSGTASPALRLDVSNSFEILPPEPDAQYEEYDLAVEEYMSDDTDGDTDTYSRQHDDAVRQLEKLILSGHRSSRTDSASERAEIPSASSGGDIPADKIQQPQQEHQQQQQDSEDGDNLNDVEDPELRKALKKMRKLDKILRQKVSREKEVKRQRQMMHKQYQEELDRIKLGMERSEPKEEVENTEKFLALVPPPKHSEGIGDEDDEYFAASPLFRTEPPEGTDVTKQPQRSGHLSPGSESSWQTKDSEADSRQGRRGDRRRRSKVHVKPATNDDDFIQRNIQLASDAGNTIAMTDDEKNRLAELLKDVEMLNDDKEEIKESTGFELQLLPGTGYRPDRTEEEALKSLDEKLKTLMLPKNFEEICSTPLLNQPKLSSVAYQQEAFELGERILQDNKVSRDYRDRLKQIEEELVSLQTQVEKEISSPSLSQDELNDLFRQCDDVDTRTQSALSSPRTPRPTSSAHFDGELGNTLLNSSRESAAPSGATTSRTEKLSEDTLKQLLDEAKAGLGLEQSHDDSEKLDFGGEDGDEEVVPQAGGIIEVRSQQNSRISQMSSDATRVPLVSYDIIQKLLTNPRSTFEEAQRPANLSNEESDEDEARNEYNR